jgi:hypothetical protein
MAKEQGLALNPTKISGQCGRLLCCLGYEYETYGELKKGMPKCGKKVMWENRECEVTSQDVLQQKVTLRDREGTCCRVTMEELRTGQASPPAAQENPEEETHASRLTKGRPQRQQQPRKQADKGQQPQRQTDKGQQPRKQAGRGQQPQKPTNKRQPPADKVVEDQPGPVDAQPKPVQIEASEGKSQASRKRRSRRRPRSGRKPAPSKQGE